MKRYKKLSTTLPDLQSKPYTVIVVNNEMREDPNGEWVRYEDVEFSEISRISEIYEERIRELEECNDRAFDNGVEAARHRGIGNDPKTRLHPGIKTPECNCHVNIYNRVWICPAHGYKKR